MDAAPIRAQLQNKQKEYVTKLLEIVNEEKILKNERIKESENLVLRFAKKSGYSLHAVAGEVWTEDRGLSLKHVDEPQRIDEFVTLSLTLNVSSMTLFTEMSISYEPKREAAEMILHNVQFQCVLKVARKTDQQSSVEKCELEYDGEPMFQSKGADPEWKDFSRTKRTEYLNLQKMLLIQLREEYLPPKLEKRLKDSVLKAGVYPG